MTKIPNLRHSPPTQSLKGGSEPTNPVSLYSGSQHPGRIPAPATPWSGVPPASAPSIPLGGAAHGPRTVAHPGDAWARNFALSGPLCSASLLCAPIPSCPTAQSLMEYPLISKLGTNLHLC